METIRPMIVESTQTKDQFIPDFNVWSAEISQATPNFVGPFESRKGRPCKALELLLIRILKLDCRAKEAHMMAFTSYEVQFAFNASHRNRHLSARYLAKWQT